MLVAQRVTTPGLQPVFTAAVNGEMFRVGQEDDRWPGQGDFVRPGTDKPAFLWVKNSSAVDVTVSLADRYRELGGVVPAGSEQVFSPVFTVWVAEDLNGDGIAERYHVAGTVSFSTVAGVTVALLTTFPP